MPTHSFIKCQHITCRLLVFLFLFFAATIAHCDPKNTNNVLALSDSNARYDINSAQQASGLYACPEGFSGNKLAELRRIERARLKTTTLPDFKNNHRYCFFIKIRNETNNEKWMLHLSNFFIDRVDLFLFDELNTYAYRSEWVAGIHEEKINVLGRAFFLTLEKSKDYFLAVTLTADGIVAPPYIGLMSESHYYSWSKIMDYLYSLSAGIIVGLILIAFLCSVILKDVTFFWFGTSSLLLFSFFALRSHLGIFIIHQSQELHYWIWLWASGATISILLFARSFLTKEPIAKSLKKLFDIYIIYLVVFFVLCQFLPKNVCIAIYFLNSLIMMVVIFYSGIIRVLDSGRYYLIFMLGWVPVLFSILELLAITFLEPPIGTSTLSYKILREPFYQIAHMLIHFLAMLIRIDELKKEKYQAEMKHEAKSRFLASASHDLRQPLHSMGMFLDHLSDQVNSQIGKDMLAKIHHLHNAMNDSFKKLMDLSRLEADAVKPTIERIDVARLIAKLHLEFEPYARVKGLKIRFKSTVKVIHSDSELLERIVKNLVNNAIKYTEAGGVLVAFRAQKDHLLLQVWDTGCGISASDQKVIFDIYKRSEKTSNTHAGMGIGLAIVNHLVDLLGGEISVRSREQSGAKLDQTSRAKTGTVFQIKLPR